MSRISDSASRSRASGTTTSEHAGRAADVPAQQSRRTVVAAVLEVARLLGEQHQRAGEDSEANAVCGACAIRKYADLRRWSRRRRRAPAATRRAATAEPDAARRLDRERSGSPRVGRRAARPRPAGSAGRRRGRPRRSPPSRRSARPRSRERRGRRRRRADRDRRPAEAPSTEQERGADVVAAGAAAAPRRQSLGRLRERDRGGDSSGRVEAALAADRMRERAERTIASEPSTPPAQLHPQRRARTAAAKPAPLLAGGVAEPVLDERLVDRQVEEELREARRSRRRGRSGRSLAVELACRDNRGEKPKSGEP